MLMNFVGGVILEDGKKQKISAFAFASHLEQGTSLPKVNEAYCYQPSSYHQSTSQCVITEAHA